MGIVRELVQELVLGLVQQVEMTAQELVPGVELKVLELVLEQKVPGQKVPGLVPGVEQKVPELVPEQGSEMYRSEAKNYPLPA